MENLKKQQSDKLVFLGVLLFFLGLVVGLFVPLMANPRMGLSNHLEGVMNGMFIIIMGLIWTKLELSDKWLKITFWTALYGAFANFIAVFIAAMTGSGKMMPLAGGQEGAQITEAVISFLLVSLSVAMLAVCLVVLIGLSKAFKY
jgi:(hydroxyamino)benzene mutase